MAVIPPSNNLIDSAHTDTAEGLYEVVVVNLPVLHVIPPLSLNGCLFDLNLVSTDMEEISEQVVSCPQSMNVVSPFSPDDNLTDLTPAHGNTKEGLLEAVVPALPFPALPVVIMKGILPLPLHDIVMDPAQSKLLLAGSEEPVAAGLQAVALPLPCDPPHDGADCDMTCLNDHHLLSSASLHVAAQGVRRPTSPTGSRLPSGEVDPTGSRLPPGEVDSSNAKATPRRRPASGPVETGIEEDGAVTRRQSAFVPVEAGIEEDGPVTRRQYASGPVEVGIAEHGPLSRRARLNPPLPETMGDSHDEPEDSSDPSVAVLNARLMEDASFRPRPTLYNDLFSYMTLQTDFFRPRPTLYNDLFSYMTLQTDFWTVPRK